MSDLTTPLGTRTPRAAKRRWPVGTIASMVLVGFAAAILTWIAVVDHPLGGEPTALARIPDQADATPAPASGPSGGERVAGSTDGIEASGADADDIIAAVTPPPGGAVQVRLPNGTVTGMSLPVTALPELEEDGPHGKLPRVAESGLRPLDAYSRPVPEFVGSGPRIAVIVGGLGLSQTGTQEALRQLPPDVTLAFAPYGSSLDRWTTRARNGGHELLLQIPLEPFDYPANDPGPHTLTVGAPPEQVLDSLHWLMGRIGAYVGVMSYMGGRFTAEPDALGPLMAELNARGLMFVDEGSSVRSRSEDVAGAHETPYGRADIVLDAVSGEAEITARLAQLEQIARGRGLAVGVASALPVSVRTIGKWAATLEQRGITLVPISATIGGP